MSCIEMGLQKNEEGPRGDEEIQGQRQTERNGGVGGEQGIRVGGMLRAGGAFIFDLLPRQHPVLDGWG